MGNFDKIKAGSVVNFTNGCYSDYELMDTFVACEDFDYLEEAKKYYFKCHEGKKERIYHYDLEEGFLNYLIKKNLIIDCKNTEIHIGNYEFFNEDVWVKELKLEDE